jgi:hypothetical protein
MIDTPSPEPLAEQEINNDGSEHWPDQDYLLLYFNPLICLLFLKKTQSSY